MSNLRTRNRLPHNFIDGIAIQGINVTHLKDISSHIGSTLVGHGENTVGDAIDNLEDNTVKLTGNQTIDGTKTFTSTVLGSSAVESGFAAVKTGTGASQTKLFNNETEFGIRDSVHGDLITKDKASGNTILPFNVRQNGDASRLYQYNSNNVLINEFGIGVLSGEGDSIGVNNPTATGSLNFGTNNTTRIKIFSDGYTAFYNKIGQESGLEAAVSAFKIGTNASETRLFNNATECGLFDFTYGNLISKNKENGKVYLLSPLILGSGGFKFDEPATDTGLDWVSDGVFRVVINNVTLGTFSVNGWSGPVSTTAVAVASSGILTGDVGSYAFLNPITSTYEPGEIAGGSDLVYAGVSSSAILTTAYSPAGSWRCMGKCAPGYATSFLRVV